MLPIAVDAMGGDNAPGAIVGGAKQAAVELGVQFSSDVDGWITGVQFYKGPGNTGTHVGNLWTAGGTLLARATFTSESASGWQTVNFSSPVAITANTTYVASYFAPVLSCSTSSSACRKAIRCIARPPTVLQK